ncbi:hypothetical protein [Dysgonomonas mossii]|uniref:hypothetical protein n=1 Tax=Dysgonomonas mossii TaxID=163665 RepID=UPI003994E4E5
MERRKFFKSLVIGGLGATVSPILKAAPTLTSTDVKPETNIKDTLSIPRTGSSMPGKYPGKVVRVNHSLAVAEGKPSEKTVFEMLKESMLKLTGEGDLNKAWLQFVGKDDVIGLKVNPVAGKLLTTSHAVTQAVVKQLEDAGIPRSNMVIWTGAKCNCMKQAIQKKIIPA